ncbi:MAG: cytochrome P450 [Pseudomonadota bacterium]
MLDKFLCPIKLTLRLRLAHFQGASKTEKRNSTLSHTATAIVPFTPPRPKSLGPLAALLRAAITRDGNLIGLLPKQVYRIASGTIGYSRRSIIILNDPKVVRTILTDPTDIYPKNDLMVGAVAPLIGDSIFVSHADTWRKQRAMVAPAFTHMRLSAAFKSMTGALADFEQQLEQDAETATPFSLDMAMSHLTADVICRTVFSATLQSQIAKDVFDAFSIFERSVAHVEIRRLIMDPPWKDIPQHEHVLEACAKIRECLGQLLDSHLQPGANYRDIAADIIGARDDEGEPFTREELIDQLGVFFLAGHETSASVLTWCFYVLATRQEIADRVREEVQAVAGDGPLELSHIRDLHFARAVFKETLRLYPPITFIPRVAAETTRIGKRRIKKGAMLMIAPWVIHRHHDYWDKPDEFDAERFMPHREKEIVDGAYMPFGLGPRVCVGANFATIEATLIIAQLARNFDFTLEPGQDVRPVARLTTRPAEQIILKAKRR